MIRSKGSALLKRALKFYEEEGGAEGHSIYRDAITDLLHMFKDDSRITDKNMDWLLTSSHTQYSDEQGEMEQEFIDKIKTKDLPLYINKKWESPNGSYYFNERMHNEFANAKDSTAPTNRSKRKSSSNRI